MGEADIVARGVNYVLAREYILATHGEEVWARALAKLPAGHREAWEQQHLAVGTYSFSSFKAGVAAVARAAGATGDEALARMYGYIAERSLNTLYRVFFRFSSPGWVVGQFGKLWSRFFTTGTVTVESRGAGSAELTFKVPSMFLDWLGPACLGYGTKAVELAGGRDVTVRELARRHSRDDTWDVRFAIAWKE